MKGSPITIPKGSQRVSFRGVESNLYFSVMHLDINTTNVLYKYFKHFKTRLEYYSTYLQSDLYNYINVSVFLFLQSGNLWFFVQNLMSSKNKNSRHPPSTWKTPPQEAAARFGHVLQESRQRARRQELLGCNSENFRRNNAMSWNI